jgi:hypothetical protein
MIYVTFCVLPSISFFSQEKRAYLYEKATGRTGGAFRGANRGTESAVASLSSLSAKAELLNQCAVTVHVFVLQVCQQLAALTDHLEQTAAGMVVFLVLPQVVRQVDDVFR